MTAKCSCCLLPSLSAVRRPLPRPLRYRQSPSRVQARTGTTLMSVRSNGLSVPTSPRTTNGIRRQTASRRVCQGVVEFFGSRRCRARSRARRRTLTPIPLRPLGLTTLAFRLRRSRRICSHRRTTTGAGALACPTTDLFLDPVVCGGCRDSRTGDRRRRRRRRRRTRTGTRARSRTSRQARRLPHLAMDTEQDACGEDQRLSCV